MVMHETGELAHRDAEDLRGARHVPASRDDDVEGFGQKCRVVLVLRVDGQLVPLPTLAPEFAGLMMLAIGRGSSLERESEPKARERLLAVDLLLAALGGCWWPIEITADWMQALAAWLPTGWTMGAMHQLVNFAHPPSSAVGAVAALSLGALVLGWLGARGFRYE